MRRRPAARGPRWRDGIAALAAAAFPEAELEGTPWLDTWRDHEARMVVLSSRVTLPLAAVGIAAHWFLVDVPLRLEPAWRWASYRFGSAAFYLALLGLTFLPAFQRPTLSRVPLVVLTFVLGGLEAKTVQWLPTVPYLYAFVLTVPAVLLLRISVPASLATLCAACASQWLVAWRFTDVSPAKLASAATVSAILVVTFRARMSSDVRAFLTEKRELDAQRRLIETQIELDAVKTKFFTNVSHELRTPLTLVIAPLEALLSAEDRLPADVRSELALVHRNAQRLLRQIDALLHLARLDAKHETLRLEDVDFVELLRSLVDGGRALAERRNLRLELEADGNVPPLPLDRDKVEQIALNLIGNAIRYTEGTEQHPGHVRVRCGLRGALVYFEVEDDGIGIPPEHLGRVFDRFHQVPTEGGWRGGTGIGLALVKELTEFHMGTVSVRSRVGVGSRFTVELPVDASVYPPERLDRRSGFAAQPRRPARSTPRPMDLALEGPAEPAAPQAPSTSSGPRILVVDDNRDMLAFVARELGRELRVDTATDVDEALRIVARSRPDLVVSDVMMPGKSGTDLLRALRADPRTRHVPTILVTARAELTSKIESLEEGADDYLSKPFSLLELRARIRSLLARRRLERELAEKNEVLSKVNFDLVLSKRQVFLDTMEAFALAVEAKDPYTHGHSRRVSILSERLAAELELSDKDREMVRIAGILHDVGKIGTPESVLAKPGRLTGDEYETFKRHTQLGHRIVSAVRELEVVGRAILHHHERWDGGGYPSGFAGEDIPVLSRILAVCDTYDAMTSDRPYRASLGHRAAVEELARCSGEQLDPRCVAAFLRLFGDAAPEYPEFPSGLREIAGAEP